MNKISLIVVFCHFIYLAFGQDGITVKDGKVGIGTITPTEDLEVNGVLKLRDTITSENDPVISNSVATYKYTSNGIQFNSNSSTHLAQTVYTLGNGEIGILRMEGRP